jgi:hypothetical protein
VPPLRSLRYLLFKKVNPREVTYAPSTHPESLHRRHPDDEHADGSSRYGSCAETAAPSSVAFIERDKSPVKLRLSLWQRWQLRRAKRPFITVQPE